MLSSSTPATVWITGANGALGSAVTQHFLENGSKVIAFRSGRDSQAKTATHPNLSWITTDLTRSEKVRASAAEALKLTPTVDAVIHCAGGFRYTTLAEASDDDLDFLLNVNLKSSLLLAREVSTIFKRQKKGRLIFVGSKAALNPGAGMGLYSATKAGLHNLVQGLAAELTDGDIRVHGVLPGIIDTAANRSAMPGADRSAWVNPADLARLIGSLCGESQQWSSGSLLPVG